MKKCKDNHRRRKDPPTIKDAWIVGLGFLSAYLLILLLLV